MTVHLHVASAHSTHYGTARPEELVSAVVADGAPAAALTDRDGLYGIVRHVRACIAAGVGAIAGVELLTAHSKDAAPFPVTLLAHGQNQGLGWASLCRLISTLHQSRHGTGRGPNQQRPVLGSDRFRPLLVGEDGPAATLLLGPESDVGQAVLAGDAAAARALLGDWQQRLAGSIAVEVVCHFTEPGHSASLPHAAAMLDLARAAGVPAVLTNAARYLSPDDAVTGDLLDAAGALTRLGGFDEQPNGQAWLKPAVKMAAIARMVVDASSQRGDAVQELLTAAEVIAERCIQDPDADLRWRQPKIPELSLLGISGEPNQVLAERCRAGITQRYPGAYGAARHRIESRLDMELRTIAGFGFAGFFLTVADVSDTMTELGIRHQARGSGAGSLVNHLLGVSNVDPLAHDLLFERFLGHARSTLPDIDIDVESARRHEIYRAVFAKYGSDRVTLLSMQNRYRARGAVRDAGLALGLPEEVIDLIAEHVWRFNARDFRTALETKPELAPIAELAREGGSIDLLVDLTERLDRLPRHLSMHPCGVILANDQLLSVTPVQPSGMGIPMSQYDKDDVDDMGLIKLDILGVRMQSTIAYAVEQIRVHHGPHAARAGGLDPDVPYVKPDGTIDVDRIPRDDEEVFEAIRTTNTLGMFQIESPGQRELIGKLQPDEYEDLIADISLFRPGPMKGNMVEPYIASKHRRGRPRPLHPRFTHFLADAHGVVIYHEHVIRILADCMGIDFAQADELRRHMEQRGNSIEAEFRARTAERRDPVTGARLFTDADIDRIWKVLEGFGSFGFCKAHGAAFALPTWQTAWLKTRYPAEFLAGLLEHDPGMYPRRLLMAEARRLGIPILPLDVNHSQASYRLERLRPTPPGQRAQPGDLGIRLAFKDLRGISEAETARIVAGAPFESIDDFVLRARPNRTLLGRLAAVGALDSLAPGEPRGRIIAYVTERAAHRRPERTDTENMLDLSLADRLPDTAPEQSDDARIAAELEALGTEVRGHVLDTYREFLAELEVTPAAELRNLPDKSEVLVAGMRIATQTPPMKSGDRVVFISVDDGTGISDTVFFPDAQEVAGPALFGPRLLVIQGITRRTGKAGVSITGGNAWNLQELHRQWLTARRQVAVG